MADEDTKKFKYFALGTSITKVEILRETDKFVVLPPCGWLIKERRDTKHPKYWDTFDEAKAHLVGVFEKRVADYRASLSRNEKYLLEATNLKGGE